MWFCEHHFNTYRQEHTETFTYTSHGSERAYTCARRDDCPTSQLPKLSKLQLRLAEIPRLPLQDHEKGVLRVTQSSIHWLVNAVSTDAPEAADILRCESSRCHSRVVPLATLREVIHGGHNHRLLANVDARCAPYASMCLIMACLMFRASMPTTMRFCIFFTTYLAQPRNVRLIPVESIAVVFIMAIRVIRHKWMPQFLRGARVQRCRFVNNYRAVRSRA